DDDVSRAGVARDGDRHAPDRAGPRHEHVLAEDGERQRGVHGVAERVEDRGDLVGDARPVVPDVGHGERDVLGERAWPLHPQPDRVGAEMPATRHAVPATPADDVALTAHALSDGEPADGGAHLDALADELVADHERDRDRPLRPRIPAVDVDVGPADPSDTDPDQDVVDPDLRLGDLLEPDPGLCTALHERLHGGESYAGHRLVGSPAEAGAKEVGMATETTITAHEAAAVEEANGTRRTPVVVVHGLWLLPSSWDRWATVFSEAGYAPVTPGWPDDPETVEEANANPDVFAHKTVGQVADHFEAIIRDLDRKPA